VLLSGLCNNNVLESFEDRLEVRFMDEILEIERQLGEVAGIASLQYGGEEPVYINKEDIEYEVFPEPEVIEAPVKVDGEGDDEQPPAPVDEEEDANKPPPFDPKIFDWTVTNKKA
jgi:hypothetical protein